MSAYAVIIEGGGDSFSAPTTAAVRLVDVAEGLPGGSAGTRSWIGSVPVPRIGYSWGETEAERAARYACDDLMPEPEQSAYRAIDVDAPAPLVWRWLGQLRVAPYSYDWIDNWGRRSPRELTPGLEAVALGQRAMIMFEIAGFEPDRSLTLHAKRSVFGEVAVTYRVVPRADESSRITAKVIVTYPRVARLMRHVPPLGDLVMMRKQLRTLKKLAERDHDRGQRPAGSSPS